MNWNPSRFLAVAAGVVIVALTAAAFWLSYAHLAEVALANGMENKEIRAWAWPATLDLFIVAGELLMLRAALAGEVDPWAIGLTVVGSGSSIALNVAGVGTSAGKLDYVVAAVPPTAALLAFGALMRQIHQALAGRAEPNLVDIVPEVPAPEVTAEVTVERVADDQLKALPAPPEVVPAGVRLLPLVARPAPAPGPSPYQWDHIRGRLVDDQERPLSGMPDLVTTSSGERSPNPDSEGYSLMSTPGADLVGAVTTSVPAETPRQVVTEVVTLTPSELRRRASKLNRELVTSTGRPVTIERLREEFGLSRRDAAELRREVVGTVALVPPVVKP
ncbi:DUF2637 domain-containing protein [Streptomyces sp. ND04-05B]|uniref:DUF2637 domain-containing protein n=1 Tax=Streptomyces sp. ND04-05B TaxID=3028693 RepID=UPI0029BF838D|nr:DUF2637 domain-containing protein [Streptomyces sp. ND04-05B]MDX3068812.1 DUF2637 domain-containing protein [Streptomyces sp. ND04-05B]